MYVTLHTLGDYYSLERIITSLSDYPGGLSPLESLITSHSVPLGDYHPLLRITTSH